MNREEVIASMASKLAEGSVVNAKKKIPPQNSSN
jgi:fumarate hydratase class II